MKVLFITNYPSPYRVDFFNLLGMHVELAVVFTENIDDQKHRSSKWFNMDFSGFHPIFLKDKVKIGKICVCRDIFKILKNKYDCIILGGYSSGTQMAVIDYLRRHKIPFAIEADGGMIKKESIIHKLIKKHFIGSADYWLSSGKKTSEYFLHYGAKDKNIYVYPFTSIKKNEILAFEQLCNYKHFNDKNKIRERLLISEPKIILYVGQMIYRKGIDVLLKAAKELPNDIAICLVGGEPTNDYLDMKESLDLQHVYFFGFQPKANLADFYIAADLFVMPTREDIWGLVINEAMCYGLPIVSTERCVAACELVENNINGLIVPSDSPTALAEGIVQVLESDTLAMKKESLKRIEQYTIENMVKAHIDFIESLTLCR